MITAVTWFGDRAVHVAAPDPDARSALLADLRRDFPGMDVRPGLETVLVGAPEPDSGLRARVVAWLDARGVHTEGAPIAGPASGATAEPPVQIPVTYDGHDLRAAAEALGCSPHALVRCHVEQEWSVAMMGFAPGFGYLVPVGPARLPWGRVPRRDRPRTRVPAGSVAVAAGMSAVYPTAMPGGWLLIGTSAVTLFDVDDPVTPALLTPGAVVRFVEEPA